MIYLIGGPVRVGKSRLARMMLERRAISGISTDALTSTIGKLWPETGLRGGVPDEEWEMNFYPFLKRFIALIGADYADYVIEGAVISPNVVQRLSKHFETRPVFVDITDISLEEMRTHMGSNTWLNKVDEQEVVRIPGRIAAKSRQIERACEEYGFAYVDLAGNYRSQLETAYRHLA